MAAASRDGAARANPADAFYAASPTALALGSVLRTIDRVSPRLGLHSAMRLFFTPLPWKFAMRRPLPHHWHVAAWPFEGVTVTTYMRRDLERGRPRVLLVHGWAGSGLQMLYLADTLAQAGFEPVLLDFPAHGRSAGWRSSLPQFSRALFAAAARLGRLHAVVAHSAGATATLHAAARGLPADRLVLVSPSSPPALFLRWFAGSFRLGPGLSERMYRQIEQCEAVALGEFEPEWLGPRVAQPCLVLHDEGDRIAPIAAGERIASALPDGRLHQTRGLGHRRLLEDDGVAQAVTAHLVGG